MTEARALTLRALVLAVLAGGIARLALTDAHLAYVQPSMRLPLLVSVVVIGVLAASSANRADQVREAELDARAEGEHDEGEHHESDEHAGRDAHRVDVDDHGHAHRGHPALPRIGWWLIAPVVCIALVPIVPLGADAVGDRASNEVLGRSGDGEAGPAGSDGVDEDGRSVDGGEVTLLDFVSRTVNDPTNPYPEPVTLVGFVTDDPTVTDGFVLGRFVVSCCAADALPLLVRIDWAGDVPPRDTWVEVTGDHVPAPADLPQGERPEVANIVVRATEVVPIPEPSQPYESI